MKRLLLFAITILSSFSTSFSQENPIQEKTIEICDILSIDYDKNDNKPDGIVDLNTYADGLEGTWVDPEKLDVLNGSFLYTWKLKNATQTLDRNDSSKQGYYTFILKKSDESELLRLYVKLAPFTGVPVNEGEDVKAIYCYDIRADLYVCKRNIFDLRNVFKPDFPNHKNGTWEYNGNMNDLLLFNSNLGTFSAVVPYESKPNSSSLRNIKYYDFTYIVKGVDTPNAICGVSEMRTRVKVAVVRSANAGINKRERICEDDIKNYNNTTLLRDYLENEDDKGKWSDYNDGDEVITYSDNHSVNLKDLFDKKVNIPEKKSRFGVEKLTYSYSVTEEGNICSNDQSKLEFIFIEKVRPFTQKKASDKKNEFCIGSDELSQPINLYDYLEFSKEDNITYDYPNNTEYNGWELVSSPVLDSIEKIDPLWKENVNKRARATFDFSKINYRQSGTYKFKYSVETAYNDTKGILREFIGKDCEGEPIYDSKGACETTTSAIVTIFIHPKAYPGEDTLGLEFCETKFETPVDLISLLRKDKDKGKIATTGIWTNIDDNDAAIANPFTLPTITGEKQSFNFEYTTTSDKGCIDSSNLSFIVYTTNKSGEGTDVEVCKSTPSFNLFEKLTNNPSTKGKWMLPDGTESTGNNLIINPVIAQEGKYTYITSEVKDTKDAKLCDGESTFITLKIATPYPGEDTSGLEYCETFFNKPVDLTSLLTKVNSKSVVDGKWFDLATNQEVSKLFTLPQLTAEKQLFNFEHRTASDKGCIDSAQLSFTVYRVNTSGTADDITICTTEGTVRLFDLLKANPSNKGKWILPDKTEFSDYNFELDPSRAQSGDYVYKTPDVLSSNGNILCEGKETTLDITIEEVPSAGKDVENTVCASDLVADLSRFLQGADQGGAFYNEEGEKLASSAVKLEEIAANKTHIYTYKLPDATCKGDEAIIKLNVVRPPTPIAKDQEFCVVKDVVTIEDLEVSGGDGHDYEWFESETSLIPLQREEVLKDGKAYYVASKDDTCFSKRTKIKVTFTPLNTKGCNTCISGGFSPNGDGINDVLSLCNLTNTYPSFEITIHNRYGVAVYKGNRSTPSFDGTSNSGSKLPSGVYFYVFTPNDGKTKPIQGDFYLGR